MIQRLKSVWRWMVQAALAEVRSQEGVDRLRREREDHDLVETSFAVAKALSEIRYGEGTVRVAYRARDVAKSLLSSRGAIVTREGYRGATSVTLTFEIAKDYVERPQVILVPEKAPSWKRPHLTGVIEVDPDERVRIRQAFAFIGWCGMAQEARDRGIHGAFEIDEHGTPVHDVARLSRTTRLAAKVVGISPKLAVIDEINPHNEHLRSPTLVAETKIEGAS